MADIEKIASAYNFGDSNKGWTLMLIQVALNVAPSLEHQHPMILGTWIQRQLDMEYEGNFPGLLDGIRQLARIEKCFRPSRRKGTTLTHPLVEPISGKIDHAAAWETYTLFPEEMDLVMSALRFTMDNWDEAVEDEMFMEGATGVGRRPKPESKELGRLLGKLIGEE